MRHLIQHGGYQQLCQQTDFSIAEADAFIEAALAGLQPAPQPVIIHMLGIPGSGKTTLAQNILPTNTLYLDCDNVMKRLPGYRHDKEMHGNETAFTKWELCAREIAYEILFRAIERNLNILFDHSGSRPDHVEMLKFLKEKKGYHVKIHALHLDQETALARALKRDRYLPPEYIPARQKIIDELKPSYQLIADEYTDVSGTSS